MPLLSPIVRFSGNPTGLVGPSGLALVGQSYPVKVVHQLQWLPILYRSSSRQEQMSPSHNTYGVLGSFLCPRLRTVYQYIYSHNGKAKDMRGDCRKVIPKYATWKISALSIYTPNMNCILPLTEIWADHLSPGPCQVAISHTGAILKLWKHAVTKLRTSAGIWQSKKLWRNMSLPTQYIFMIFAPIADYYWTFQMTQFEFDKLTLHFVIFNLCTTYAICYPVQIPRCLVSQTRLQMLR